MSDQPQNAASSATIADVSFSADGLVPVITQDADSLDVLMHAWMNAEALKLTIDTKQVTYWSRSRNTLWRKGATSGNTQQLISLHLDCDGDTILARVKQRGPACHTGAANCFFKALK